MPAKARQGLRDLGSTAGAIGAVRLLRNGFLEGAWSPSIARARFEEGDIEGVRGHRSIIPAAAELPGNLAPREQAEEPLPGRVPLIVEEEQ